MKNINFLGKYQHTDSLLHRIDARVKIIIIFSLIVFMFFLKSYYSYIAFLVFVGFLVILVRVRPSSVILSLRPIIFLIVFSIIFQLFFSPGKVIFQWHFVKITEEGLNLAFYISLRLVILSILTFLLTSTTSTVELAEAFKKIISPLKYIKFPSDEIALMISIALQFVPILFEEADRIMKAQTSRGVDFNRGSIIQRAKSFFPIVLPLLLNAFDRADQLAMAMESRGFVIGAKRTSYYERRLKRIDFVSMIFVILFSAFVYFMDLRLWRIF